MDYLSSSQVAKLLGVTTDTLRIWELNGKLIPVSKTEGGHRRYLDKQIVSLKQEIIMNDNDRYIANQFNKPPYPFNGKHYLFEGSSEVGKYCFEDAKKIQPSVLDYIETAYPNEYSVDAKLKFFVSSFYLFRDNNFCYCKVHQPVDGQQPTKYDYKLIPYSSIEYLEFIGSDFNGTLKIRMKYAEVWDLTSKFSSDWQQIQNIYKFLISKVN